LTRALARSQAKMFACKHAAVSFCLKDDSGIKDNISIKDNYNSLIYGSLYTVSDAHLQANACLNVRAKALPLKIVLPYMKRLS